jgi:hypothetical protein
MANPRFQLTIWQLIKLVIFGGVVAALLLRSDLDLLSSTICMVGALAIVYETKTRKTPHAGHSIGLWLLWVSIAVIYGIALYIGPVSIRFRMAAPSLLIAATPDSFRRWLSSSARRLIYSARRLIYSLYPPYLTDESCGHIRWRGYEKVSVDRRRDG